MMMLLMQMRKISLPIWGEEIIVNKRMVKLGEIVIKKYEINEKPKIDVEVKTEKLTVIYLITVEKKYHKDLVICPLLLNSMPADLT